MSLAIDIDEVQAVLIAGVWYEVLEASFGTDAYEYVWGREGDILMLGGGQEREAGVPATGFHLDATVSGSRCQIVGPINSIQAIIRRR